MRQAAGVLFDRLQVHNDLYHGVSLQQTAEVVGVPPAVSYVTRRRRPAPDNVVAQKLLYGPIYSVVLHQVDQRAPPLAERLLGPSPVARPWLSARRLVPDLIEVALDRGDLGSGEYPPQNQEAERLEMGYLSWCWQSRRSSHKTMSVASRRAWQKIGCPGERPLRPGRETHPMVPRSLERTIRIGLCSL